MNVNTSLLAEAKDLIASSIVTGVAATTVMTAFSYGVSNDREKYFKEPKILNQLFARSSYNVPRKIETKTKPLPGVIGHYATGVLFSSFYNFFWRRVSRLQPFTDGAAFGLTFGLLGIGIWKSVLTIHHNPPDIHVKRFAGHLLLAHLLFGETVAIVASKLNK